MTKSTTSFRLSAALLMTTLASSVVVLGAPANSQQTSSSTTPASTTAASTTSTTTTTAASTLNGRQLSPLATELRGMPSLVGLRGAASSEAKQGSPTQVVSADEENSNLGAFDGKNPFADDSLWQIPIHLVRDVSASAPVPASSGDKMAKSASEMSSAANDDDETSDLMDDDSTTSLLEHQQSQQQQQQPRASASNSPTVISASTDLKTAAGYHHATPHHYEGGHHGGDHYGKYFQYASVPYPYAWDFGYRRGNPYHTIERYEHGKGPHFQTKVKWNDKHAGYGVHVWDYNHDDHHSHHYGGDEHHGYDAHHGPSHHGAGHHYGGGHH